MPWRRKRAAQRRARWHRPKANLPDAGRDAHEALPIADRCEYRLAQADAHNFVARLALDAGDNTTAADHARTAYQRAWCDAPPHCYKPALDEAARLLTDLREPLPEMS